MTCLKFTALPGPSQQQANTLLWLKETFKPGLFSKNEVHPILEKLETYQNNMASLRIRDIEETLRDIETLMLTLEKKTAQYRTDPQIYSEQTLKDWHTHLQLISLLNTQKECLKQANTQKIEALVTTFKTDCSEEKLRLFLKKMRDEIGNTKALKKEKIDTVYTAFETFIHTRQTDILITACATFLSSAKTSSLKATFIKALQTKLETNNTSLGIVRERTSTLDALTERFSDILDQYDPTNKHASLGSQIRRKSNSLASATLTDSLNSSLKLSIQDLKYALKKSLLMTFGNALYGDTKQRIAKELQEAFTRIDAEFVDRLGTVPLDVFQASPNGTLTCHSETTGSKTYTIDYSQCTHTNNAYLYRITPNATAQDIESILTSSDEESETSLDPAENNSNTPTLVLRLVPVGIYGAESGQKTIRAQDMFREITLIHTHALSKETNAHFATYHHVFILIKDEMPYYGSILEHVGVTGTAYVTNTLTKLPLGKRIEETYRLLEDCASTLIEHPDLIYEDLTLAQVARWDKTWKIFDFSSCHDKGELTAEFKTYKAPELFKDPAYYIRRPERSEKLHVFALGIMAMQFLTGNTDIAPSYSEAEFKTKKCHALFDCTDLALLNEAETHFFKTLLDPKPKTRTSLQQLLEDIKRLRQLPDSVGITHGQPDTGWEPSILSLQRHTSTKLSRESLTTLHADPDICEYTLTSSLTIQLRTSHKKRVLPAHTSFFQAPMNPYAAFHQDNTPSRKTMICFWDETTKEYAVGYTEDPIDATENRSMMYNKSVSKLYNDTGLPSPNDIQQRFLGDCYLLSVLQGIALYYPEYIKNNLIQENPDETVSVFFIRVEKTDTTDTFVKDEVKIKKTVPYIGPFSYLSAGPSWVSLIEKAYTVWRGYSTYNAISGGLQSTVFKEILGDIAVQTLDIAVPEEIHKDTPFVSCVKEYGLDLLSQLAPQLKTSSDLLQDIATRLQMSKDTLFTENRVTLQTYLLKAKVIRNRTEDITNIPIIPSLYVVSGLFQTVPQLHTLLQDNGFISQIETRYGIHTPPCFKEKWIVTDHIRNKDHFWQCLQDQNEDTKTALYDALIGMHNGPKLMLPNSVSLLLRYPSAPHQDILQWFQKISLDTTQQLIRETSISETTPPYAKQIHPLPIHVFRKLVSETQISQTTKALLLNDAQNSCTGYQEQTPFYSPHEIRIFETIAKHFGDAPGLSGAIIGISTANLVQHIVTITTPSHGPTLFFGNHAYLVVGCRTDATHRRVVTLRNPHGFHRSGLSTPTEVDVDLGDICTYFSSLTLCPLVKQDGKTTAFHSRTSSNEINRL